MPVYFLRAGETGPVKIGWSDQTKTRQRALQHAHYEPLHIIRILDGIPLLERWLHAHFAELRLRGEWFRFDPEMLVIEPPALLADVPADFVAYLDNGFPVLAGRLAEWMTTA